MLFNSRSNKISGAYVGWCPGVVKKETVLHSPQTAVKGIFFLLGSPNHKGVMGNPFSPRGANAKCPQYFRFSCPRRDVQIVGDSLCSL